MQGIKSPDGLFGENFEVGQVSGGAGEPKDDRPVRRLDMVGQHQRTRKPARGQRAGHNNFSSCLLLEALRIKAPRRARAPVGQTTIRAIAQHTQQRQQQAQKQQHIDDENCNKKEINKPNATGQNSQLHEHTLARGKP